MLWRFGVFFRRHRIGQRQGVVEGGLVGRSRFLGGSIRVYAFLRRLRDRLGGGFFLGFGGDFGGRLGGAAVVDYAVAVVVDLVAADLAAWEHLSLARAPSGIAGLYARFTRPHALGLGKTPITRPCLALFGASAVFIEDAVAVVVFVVVADFCLGQRDALAKTPCAACAGLAARLAFADPDHVGWGSIDARALVSICAARTSVIDRSVAVVVFAVSAIIRCQRLGFSTASSPTKVGTGLRSIFADADASGIWGACITVTLFALCFALAWRIFVDLSVAVVVEVVSAYLVAWSHKACASPPSTALANLRSFFADPYIGDRRRPRITGLCCALLTRRRDLLAGGRQCEGLRGPKWARLLVVVERERACAWIRITLACGGLYMKHITLAACGWKNKLCFKGSVFVIHAVFSVHCVAFVGKYDATDRDGLGGVIKDDPKGRCLACGSRRFLEVHPRKQWKGSTIPAAEVLDRSTRDPHAEVSRAAHHIFPVA